MPVMGTGNTQLGTVGDVLIDPNTFGLQYVVLNPNTSLGITGMPVIPWMLFQSPGVAATGTVNGAGTNLFVPLTSARLASAPVMTGTSTDFTRSANWVNQADQFFAQDLQQQRVARPDLNAQRCAIAVQRRESQWNQPRGHTGRDGSPGRHDEQVGHSRRGHARGNGHRHVGQCEYEGARQRRHDPRRSRQSGRDRNRPRLCRC